MLVLITGDRNWRDRKKIEARLSKLPKGTIIIAGGADGADTLAKRVAWSLGLHVMECKALWGFYKISAGPIRNRAMLSLKPDLVIAFHSDLSKSKGTKDCVTEAKRRGIEVEVIA